MQQPQRDPSRRYVDALESAILGLFSNRRSARNEPLLWTSVRAVIESLLQAHWQHGGLQGRTPGEAFFVRCDLTTMRAEDITAGRLIADLGMALLRPSEFEVFGIESKVKAPGQLPPATCPDHRPSGRVATARCVSVTDGADPDVRS